MYAVCHMLFDAILHLLSVVEISYTEYVIVSCCMLCINLKKKNKEKNLQM